MGAVIATPIAVGFSLLVASPTGIVTFLKWIVSYGYIEYHRWTSKKRFDLYDYKAERSPEKVGFLPPQEEYGLESPQPESHLLSAADEVFFYGVNSDSECLTVRIARSVNDEAEAWIHLKLKDGTVYRLRETSGYQNSCRDEGREFTCGALRVNYMTPMRKWRIFYNGMLRETSEKDETVDKIVYVKFAFIWIASSDCFDSTADINSMALAVGFAKTKWETFTPPLEKLNQLTNFYAQSGNFTGTLKVQDSADEKPLLFFGEKVRFLGDSSLAKGATFTHVLGQISKTGCVFHVTEASIPGVLSKIRFGFVVFSNGELHSVSDTDMLFAVETGKTRRVVFHADDQEFDVEATLLGKETHFDSKKERDGSLIIRDLKLEINHKLSGGGVLIKREILQHSTRRSLKRTGKVHLEDVPVAVPFSDGICELSEVTGGKGSSLGKLTQLSKELQNFIVPSGIVVTTSAYQQFLNDDVRKEIKRLETVLYGNTDGDVKKTSERVMEKITASKMPDSVCQGVVKCLENTFGDHLPNKKFAVRSSATGEDTEQMSAAGQMETYLGVTGLEDIVLAVKKCWASQFGFVAIQYKRQNGQVLNSPMAVVIQEMISCDVAGVLFTCDPLTGNPTLMSITANYGLGESVVSGSEEPDTIILERLSGDQLRLKEKIIGAKTRRIVVREEAGTTIEDVPEHEKSSCCLSDDLVLRLGSIAVRIEKSYRSHRDIEWGFWNNNLYVFQSRPITSGTGETDFEIDHGTDSHMRIEHECFTVCNVGEVFPGAQTPLTIDVLFKYFAITFKRGGLASFKPSLQPNYYDMGLCHMYGHVMFYCLDLLGLVKEGKDTAEAAMISLFGRIIEDEELFELALERVERDKSVNLYTKLDGMYKNLFAAPKELKKALKIYVNYSLPTANLKNSQEIFDMLMNSCDGLCEAHKAHMIATPASSIWNGIVIAILSKAKGGMSSEVYQIFSKLLASIKGVESADVPAALQTLAYHIGNFTSPEEFRKMKCEDIGEWLNTCQNEAGVKYREFLSKHGHRCLREFDLISTTWESDPKLLIEILKNLVGNVKDSSEKPSEDADKILSELKLSFSQRMMLKFLLPRCRIAVQTREGTKSLLIKGMDAWRKGYRQLAKMMASEGRIPDEDLMYFMLLEEIKELLSTRSPKIIARANHRRRRYQELDKYIFPEIMKGFPHPVNLDNAPVVPTEDNFMMKGIPVSQGVAKGFVRVALTLEEASHLKPGEILLTYSTDIGWTPYFPALAGVVTELGGLISHGAVVSREYGLPCIAGLHGATRQFQTGDYVLLDGNKGILQKIPPPENQ